MLDRDEMRKTSQPQAIAKLLQEQLYWYGIIPSKRHVIRRNFLCGAVWIGGLQWNPWLMVDQHVRRLNVWRLYLCTPCLIKIWEWE